MERPVPKLETDLAEIRARDKRAALRDAMLRCAVAFDDEGRALDAFYALALAFEADTPPPENIRAFFMRAAEQLHQVERQFVERQQTDWSLAVLRALGFGPLAKGARAELARLSAEANKRRRVTRAVMRLLLAQDEGHARKLAAEFHDIATQCGVSIETVRRVYGQIRRQSKQ